MYRICSIYIEYMMYSYQIKIRKEIRKEAIQEQLNSKLQGKQYTSSTHEQYLKQAVLYQVKRHSGVISSHK